MWSWSDDLEHLDSHSYRDRWIWDFSAGSVGNSHLRSRHRSYAGDKHLSVSDLRGKEAANVVSERADVGGVVEVARLQAQDDLIVLDQDHILWRHHLGIRFTNTKYRLLISMAWS